MRQLSSLRIIFTSSPLPYHLLRAGIGLLFIWTGTIKLYNPKAFAMAIANYEILPDFLIGPVALGLPALELIAGVGLLLDVAFGFGLTFGLLLLFLGVLAFAMTKGLDIDCGCFSAEELGQRSSLQATFMRDMVLAASVIFLFYCRRLRAGRTKPILMEE